MECAICVEDITYSDKVKVISCGHMFHKVCILKWMIENPICPFCREKSSESSYSILSQYSQELCRQKRYYTVLEKYIKAKIMYNNAWLTVIRKCECRFVYENRVFTLNKTKDVIERVKNDIKKELSIAKWLHWKLQ